MRLVVTPAVSFAGAGVALGVIAALGASRWIEPLLFGESARDPVVFGAVAGVVAVVSIVASAEPAMRATRADPNTALRTEA